MKRVDVDEMLDEMSAQDLLRWFAFFAVRNERQAQARREAADAAKYGDDDEVTNW